MRILVFISLVLGLSACGTIKGIFGGGGDTGAPLIAEEATPTKDLLKNRPEGLLPDYENQRHTQDDLKSDGGQ